MEADASYSAIELSDRELAADAAAGSLAAFERLVQRYQVPLLRMLMARCRNRHLAEDVLQNAFLKMYQGMGGFDLDRPFRHWAFAIAHHCLVDAMRALPPTVDAESAEPAALSDPSKNMLRCETHDRLWDVVRRTLSTEQFTAIWLFYIEQLPSVQIASVLGRSDAWVRTSLSRARAELLPHVQPLMQELS